MGFIILYIIYYILYIILHSNNQQFANLKKLSYITALNL